MLGRDRRRAHQAGDRFDPRVGRHVERREIPEIIVEPTSRSPPLHRLGEIDVLAGQTGRGGSTRSRSPVSPLRRPLHPEGATCRSRRAVTLRLGAARAIVGRSGLDQRGLKPSEHAALQARAPAVAPGEQAMRRRRPRRVVRIGELHAFAASQSIPGVGIFECLDARSARNRVVGEDDRDGGGAAAAWRRDAA